MTAKTKLVYTGIALAIVIAGLAIHILLPPELKPLAASDSFSIGNRYTNEMSQSPVMNFKPGAWPASHKLGSQDNQPKPQEPKP